MEGSVSLGRSSLLGCGPNPGLFGSGFRLRHRRALYLFTEAELPLQIRLQPVGNKGTALRLGGGPQLFGVWTSTDTVFAGAVFRVYLRKTSMIPLKNQLPMPFSHLLGFLTRRSGQLFRRLASSSLDDISAINLLTASSFVPSCTISVETVLLPSLSILEGEFLVTAFSLGRLAVAEESAGAKSFLFPANPMSPNFKTLGPGPNLRHRQLFLRLSVLRSAALTRWWRRLCAKQSRFCRTTAMHRWLRGLGRLRRPDVAGSNPENRSIFLSDLSCSGISATSRPSSATVSVATTALTSLKVGVGGKFKL
ncbi:hypothetical protein EVAR_19127_1 [Eumeta japonica]|uniref:Uncharacterized protein n=1 Tax=Eumeta variegata TaxID=151549 RepID=A0A4C1SS67_EUMVA|nr:hypothetical protein EVAR_19127_1 [Eumeta japonica]